MRTARSGPPCSYGVVPNVVGPWGLLQSFADFLKFALKEPIIPAGANKGVFLLAPVVTGTLSISAFAVIPVDWGWAVSNLNVGVLYLFAISSLERLRRHHGGLGLQLEISLLVGASGPPPRWCPTRSRSASCW